MKKILIAIVLLIVIGGGGAWFYLHSQKVVRMEDCLAANPIFYVKFSDVENNVTRFTQSNLWKKIAQIDYDLIINKTFFDPGQKASATLLKKQITDPNLWNILNKFLGREFAFAVYPSSVNLTSNSPQLVEELSSSFVLVTRIETDLQVAEFISRSFKDLGPNVAAETVKYKSHTIHLVTLSDLGMKVGFVRLGNVLVVGVGDKMVKEAIDLSTHRKPTLTNDESFKKAEAQFMPSSAITGYWNIETFFISMKSQLEQMSAGSSAAREQMGNFLKTVSGFKVLSFSATQADLITMNWRLYSNLQEMDSHVAKFYTACSPRENKSINLVPSDAIGYGWGTCVNLAGYWEEFEKEVEKIDHQTGKQEGHKNIEKFEQTTGFNIENDIIPAFGNEMGGYISDIQATPSAEDFPLPKMLFFVEYGDKVKMDALLDKLNGNPLFSIKEDDYKGISIKSISVPTQNQVQPGFCYLDKYLLVAMDKSLLQKSVDAWQDQSHSLVSQDDLKKLGAEMTSPATSIQFAKLDQFVGILQRLLEWSENAATQEKAKREAFKMGTKRRLSDVGYQMDLNRETIAKLKKDAEAVTAQISQQPAGTDVSALELELKGINNQISATEKDIAAEVEQKKELEARIAQYEQDEAKDAEEKQFMLKKAVLPILEALKSVRLLGGFSTLENQTFSTTIKLEVQ